MLPRQRIPRLRDLVPRPPDLDHIPPHLHPRIHTKHVRVLCSPFLLLPRCSSSEVGLVLAALGVGEVGSIVLVHGEAEAAFEGADVVLEEVGVFVEVDGFEREFAETFAAVGVRGGVGGYSSSAEFAAGTQKKPSRLEGLYQRCSKSRRSQRDNSIIQQYIEAEQESSSPRKEMRGHINYASRAFYSPSGKSIGELLLSDFGSVVSGDVEHNEDIRDLLEGKHMFYGKDPKEKRYMTRAYLADMIALMGPPPPELLKGEEDCRVSDNSAKIPVPARACLEESEENLEGSNKEAFLRFVRKMVQGRPEDRQTANQLLKDDWYTWRK
ncbi:MAG: hypothetical protein Q9184_007364 [Pyrenodesmia sp. 2 TL-2023]